MIDNVLTIKTGFSDLLPMPEFYQVVTYSQKREELLSLIYEIGRAVQQECHQGD